MSDPYPRVIALVTTAAEELLARHGVVGTIGFASPHTKGHLAVLADETFWRRVAWPSPRL